MVHTLHFNDDEVATLLSGLGALEAEGADPAQTVLPRRKLETALGDSIDKDHGTYQPFHGGDVA